MSLEATNKDMGSSKNQQESSSQEDIDLLIRLEPDDAEMQDIGGDDSKLNITGEIEQTTKLNENKIEDTKHKSEETYVRKGKFSKSNYIWVSNITRDVKAADLKMLFCQIGKVSSVKILTNGKNLYGYVAMESPEKATKCVTDFNNTVFHGEKISVSRNRPDIVKKSNDSRKIKVDKSNRIRLEKKADTIESKVDEKINTNDNDNEKASVARESRSEDQQRSMNKLKSKLDTMYQSNNKLQRRFDEMQRLYNTVSIKYSNLKEEIKKIKYENREERRRLNLDKENFEKMKKIEESRLDLDRITLNKELSETKKLKENLRCKIEDFRYQKRKLSRSPIRSPRRRSPLGSRSVDASRSEKKFKRSDNYHRGRTPSPPKLGSEISKRPGNAATIPSRPPYYSDGLKAPGTSFPYRQTTYAQNHWLGAYQKDQRRTNSSINQGNNFQNTRYNGPTNPQSSVVIPPRTGNNYYQHW